VKQLVKHVVKCFSHRANSSPSRELSLSLNVLGQDHIVILLFITLARLVLVVDFFLGFFDVNTIKTGVFVTNGSPGDLLRPKVHDGLGDGKTNVLRGDGTTKSLPI